MIIIKFPGSSALKQSLKVTGSFETQFPITPMAPKTPIAK